MDLHDFTNRWKILRSIDRIELTDGGVYLDDGQWSAFRADPHAFLVSIGDFVATKLWAVVESRCKPEPKGYQADTPQGYAGLLEPTSMPSALGQQDTPAARSSAISLKRIADALERRYPDPTCGGPARDAGR